jgi:chromate transporter
MIAVSESTPGPIMINLATYVGSVKGGFLGSAVATFAVVLPSFVIILLVMVIFRRLMHEPCVKAVIDGLIPCVIGIISAVGGYMMLRCCFATGTDWTPDFKALLLTLFLAFLMFGSKPVFRRKMSPITLILVSAVLGIVFY